MEGADAPEQQGGKEDDQPGGGPEHPPAQALGGLRQQELRGGAYKKGGQFPHAQSLVKQVGPQESAYAPSSVLQVPQEEQGEDSQSGPQGGQQIPPPLSPEPAQPHGRQEYQQHTGQGNQIAGTADSDKGPDREWKREPAAEENRPCAAPPQGDHKGGVGDGEEQGGVEHELVAQEGPAKWQTPQGGQREKEQRRRRHPFPPQKEGVVGKPESGQNPGGQQQAQNLPPEVEDVLGVPHEPGGEELEQHARGKEGRHSDRQPPAVLGAVKAVQLPAHRLRLSHLGHRAGQGLFRAPALRLKGGGLIGNMVGQLPQENPPGPPPADLAAHRLQIFVHALTRHRDSLPPARRAPRRRRRTSPPAVQPGRPGRPG